MIRINLLAAERKARQEEASRFQTAQKSPRVQPHSACSPALVIGWRYWLLQQQSTQLDSDIAAAQQETHAAALVIAQVQQFEQRKAQLQQRVTLIEQLRNEQTGPVHMLDQISRSLPPSLWLTEMKQTGDEVLIDGKSISLTGLSDFVVDAAVTARSAAHRAARSRCSGCRRGR